MKIRTMVLAAAVTLGLGAGEWMMPRADAQPAWDVLHVTLPYAVVLGNKTLAPGDYTIRQLHGEDSRVLVLYDTRGRQFETSAVTVRALDENTPGTTSVTLHHIGNAYYFDKILISGKDYGYLFPLRPNVDLEKEIRHGTK